MDSLSRLGPGETGSRTVCPGGLGRWVRAPGLHAPVAGGWEWRGSQHAARAVRRFLESHGEGRFTWWHRASDNHNAKTLQRAGFRRMVDQDGKPIKSDAEHQREHGERMAPVDGETVSVEYFLLPEVFGAEVCQGFDYQAVASVLLTHGALMPGAGRSFDTRQRLPGLGLSRCYHIPPALFALDV